VAGEQVVVKVVVATTIKILDGGYTRKMVPAGGGWKLCRVSEKVVKQCVVQSKVVLCVEFWREIEGRLSFRRCFGRGAETVGA
jgi:hypothetical protein